MTEPYLTQIWLDKVDARDLNCLQIAVDASIFGHKVEHILTSVQDFTSQLWRGGCGDKRFVMVTQVFAHPGGKELRIWSVGGEGYIEAIDACYKTLIDYAKENDCKWLTGIVLRKAFERVYAKFAFTDVYRNWVLELDHVSNQAEH